VGLPRRPGTPVRRGLRRCSATPISRAREAGSAPRRRRPERQNGPVDVCMYSSRSYDRSSFTETAAARTGPQPRLRFLQDRRAVETAPFAAGCEAVCAFVNDDLGAAVLELLHEHAIRHVALRSAGYNHVDLPAAAALGMSVVTVPAYSPNAVAEHTIGLILAANRHIPRAHERVRNRNFSLEGLVGFDLAANTLGVVGPAKIAHTLPPLPFH